eukprot:2940570-Heterocapsa_arctica.AAC.1
MASIPCTAGSTWQRINIAKHGQPHIDRVNALKRDMEQLVRNLRELALHVRAGGGTVSFDWPRYCALWKETCVQQLIQEFHLKAVDFDGCAVGL